jgi:ABC-type arginine transport system permease subunit
MPVLIKVSIDIAIGITLIVLIIWQKNLFSPNSLFFMALGIIFACLPDLILTLALFFPSQKFLQKYFILHEKCFHFQHQEKEGQITFLGLATQILVVIMAIALFVS